MPLLLLVSIKLAFLVFNRKTVAGILSVDGSDLRITNLNVEKGDVDIEGNVNGMYYTTAQSGKASKTLKRRL